MGSLSIAVVDHLPHSLDSTVSLDIPLRLAVNEFTLD